ncbi:hypothetical protein EMIT0196P_100062 [Pseudomonas chlororaphis]
MLGQLQVFFDMALVVGVQAAGHKKPRQLDVAKSMKVTAQCHLAGLCGMERSIAARGCGPCHRASDCAL